MCGCSPGVFLLNHSLPPVTWHECHLLERPPYSPATVASHLLPHPAFCPLSSDLPISLCICHLLLTVLAAMWPGSYYHFHILQVRRMRPRWAHRACPDEGQGWDPSSGLQAWVCWDSIMNCCLPWASGLHQAQGTWGAHPVFPQPGKQKQKQSGATEAKGPHPGEMRVGPFLCWPPK